MGIVQNLLELKKNLPADVTLVAVSKTHPTSSILEAYRAGQRVFGENKVQELVAKYEALPKDIEWHLIGHLQTNKVKYIVPFVQLIHSVDSEKLLEEINKEGKKKNKIVSCLLQVYIASEETKFGFDEIELMQMIQSAKFQSYSNVKICGLMGMASNTYDVNQIQKEFNSLNELYEKLKSRLNLEILSMGMSSDYEIAIRCGSNMIRVGSTIFGNRNDL